MPARPSPATMLVDMPACSSRARRPARARPFVSRAPEYARTRAAEGHGMDAGHPDAGGAPRRMRNTTTDPARSMQMPHRWLVIRSRPPGGIGSLSSGFGAGPGRGEDMRTFPGRSPSPRPSGHRQIANVLIGVALLIAGCSTERNPSTQTASALKPIDQAALQSLVDTTTEELLIPGALVLLRTPRGDFTAASGTTQLGARKRPGADTHFRIASNTKTMTAAVVLQLAQERRLGLGDRVSKYVPGVPNGDDIT